MSSFQRKKQLFSLNISIPQKVVADGQIKTASPLVSPSETENVMETMAMCNIETDEMDAKISESSDINKILLNHGYKIIKKMGDTLQGEMYEAEIFSHHKMLSASYQDEKNEFMNIIISPNIQKSQNIKPTNHVVIKKSCKTLHKSRLSVQDEMNIVVEENIIKEAILLYHLTVDNKPTGDFICQFVNFFESETDYFLIMNYVSCMNLTQFINKSHQYIKSGQLQLKQYKRISKYIIWQLVVALHWLHNDMHVCHLDLSTDNIIVQNAQFIINNDGTVSINPNACIKIGDFGLAEYFKCASYKNRDQEYFEYDPTTPDIHGPFHCIKTNGITPTDHYKPPKVFNEQVYDARMSDIYSLGIILFQLYVGRAPYLKPNQNDFGYICLREQQIDVWLKKNKFARYVPSKMVNLLHGMLHFDERSRYNIEMVMKHIWFEPYFKSYGQKILKKSRLQRKRNIKKQLSVSNSNEFPYYQLSPHKPYSPSLSF